MNTHQSNKKTNPLCPIFGECGGCHYQDIDYQDELKIKETHLKNLLQISLNIPDKKFSGIVPSPKPYHYRNRLDLKLKRTKHSGILIGFTPLNSKGIIPIDACFIAEQNISDFIPELKQQAIDRLPLKYRVANLTVRTGEDQRVFWGGIGRRSCQLPEQNYFWFKLNGKKIFYSLDTFFQANLSILPKLFQVINGLPLWDQKPIFYDLYGGVGLFSIGLTDKIKKSFLIEDNPSSLKLAQFNADYNKLSTLNIVKGRVEEHLPNLMTQENDHVNIAMIDPPRAGLSEEARHLLAGMKNLNSILYLSCNPESLSCDLVEFLQQGWNIQKIIPFDFFPKTKHLETLILLTRTKE